MILTTKDDLNLYCEVHNPTASNTLILAHGNGNSVEDWHTLGFVEKLSCKYRLVLMDAIGYGNSSKPYDPARYSSEKRAEDLITVMDQLQITRAHFFGISIGGSLGFVLADLYPKRFLSFIIGSAHPYGSSEPIGCNLFPKEFCNIMIEKGMDAFVEIVEKEFLKRPFIKGVRERYLENDPRAIAAANAPTWPNRIECLTRIFVPVLLYAGELDPVSKFQHPIASQIKKADVQILQNIDHADAYWQSEKVAPIVNHFLEKNFP